MNNQTISYTVKWAQPDGGCGEEECSRFFTDREEAFHFSYTLDPQTCRGIRVLERGGLVGHYNQQTHVATVSGEPYTRQVSKSRKAERVYVVMGLSADKMPNGRQAYKVMLVGEPGESRLLVSGRRDWSILGQFTVTLSTVKRSYKRAWRAWEEAQDAKETQWSKQLYGE